MHADIESCRALIDVAIAGLDDRQAAIRVDGRWSIAEIIEHLDRTYTGTVKGMERCLEGGAPRVSAQNTRNRLRRFVVVTLGLFPTGIPAPRHVLPSGELLLSVLVARTRDHLAEMDAVLGRVRDQFGSGQVLDHPVLGPFTATDWARFHRVHTRHHCRQIDERRRRVETLT